MLHCIVSGLNNFRWHAYFCHSLPNSGSGVVIPVAGKIITD